MTQSQSHAVLSHFRMDKGSHVRVKGVHQLHGALDNGDPQPQLPQILRQLQTDEAAARQHSGLRVLLLVKVLMDYIDILIKMKPVVAVATMVENL